MTAVKPKPSHPWNSSIAKETKIARLRGEISALRREIRAKEDEIKSLQARSKPRSLDDRDTIGGTDGRRNA